MRDLTIQVRNYLARNQVTAFGLLILGVYTLATPVDQVFGSVQLEHLKDAGAALLVLLGLTLRFLMALRRTEREHYVGRRRFVANMLILAAIFLMHGSPYALLLGTVAGSAILLLLLHVEPAKAGSRTDRPRPSLIVQGLGWEWLIGASALGMLLLTEVYEHLPSNEMEIVRAGLLVAVAVLAVQAAVAFRRQAAEAAEAEHALIPASAPVLSNPAWSRERIEEMLRREKFGYQRIELPYGMATEGYDRRWTADQIFPDDMTGCSVLDLGCNHGYFCLEAHRRGATRVVGYDLKSNSVRKARLLASCLGVPAEFDVRDIEQSPVEERFDYVLCLNVLHHLANPVTVLNQVASITRRQLALEVAGVDLSFFLREPGLARLLACSLAGAPIMYVGESEKYGRARSGKSTLSFRITRPAMLRLLTDGPSAFTRVETLKSEFKHRTLFIASR